VCEDHYMPCSDTHTYILRVYIYTHMCNGARVYVCVYTHTMISVYVHYIYVSPPCHVAMHTARERERERERSILHKHTHTYTNTQAY
jgi:hypothetical protein